MPTDHSISIEEANHIIRKFLEIQEQLTDPNLLDKLPKDVQRYLGKKFLSFVFYKNQIDSLFREGGANALRIYYGAHQKGDPTLVIVPCVINPDKEGEVGNTIPPIGPGQYPVPFKRFFKRFDIRTDNTPKKRPK